MSSSVIFRSQVQSHVEQVREVPVTDAQEEEAWCAVCHAPYSFYGCAEATCHGLDND